MESQRIIASHIIAPIAGENVIRSKKTNELIFNALNLDPSTKAYELATKIEMGELRPNNNNIGELYSTYLDEGGNSSFMYVPSKELQKNAIPINELMQDANVPKYQTIQDVFADYDSGTMIAQIIHDDSARKIFLDPANTELLVEKFGFEKAKLIKEKAAVLDKKNNIVDVSQNSNNIINRGGIDATRYTEQTQRTTETSYGTETENYTQEPNAVPTEMGGLLAQERLFGQGYSGSVGVSDLTRKILDSKGATNLNLKSSSDNQAAFSNALAKAVDTNYRGAYLTKYSDQELIDGNVKTFLNDNGTAGVAVWPDGNITSVFKLDNSDIEGAVDDLIITALSNGGNKLDNFDGKLSMIYEQFGFIPVARVAFDPEYKPSNWKPEFGEPDVIFWVHNGDTPEVVAEKIGTYPKQDTKNIPLFDTYEEAYTYGDKVLEQMRQKSQPTET